MVLKKTTKTKIKTIKVVAKDVPEIITLPDYTKTDQEIFEEKPKNIYIKIRKIFITYLPWLLMIILIGFFLFRFSDIKNNSINSSKDVSEIVKIVSKLIVLPDNEVPQLATLTKEDINKLRTQQFFSNAKVGDKVLVYYNAKKIILYNPNLNKLVEVANMGNSTSSQIISKPVK